MGFFFTWSPLYSIPFSWVIFHFHLRTNGTFWCHYNYLSFKETHFVPVFFLNIKKGKDTFSVHRKIIAFSHLICVKCKYRGKIIKTFAHFNLMVVHFEKEEKKYESWANNKLIKTDRFELHRIFIYDWIYMIETPNLRVINWLGDLLQTIASQRTWIIRQLRSKAVFLC